MAVTQLSMTASSVAGALPVRLASISRLRRLAASSSSASLRSSTCSARMCGSCRALRVAYVLQQRAGGADAERQLVGAKAPEVESAELVGQQPRGARELEMPGRTRAHGSAGAHKLPAGGAFREQQLRGFEALELCFERPVAFGLQYAETPRREIEPGEAEARALAHHRGDQGIGARIQKRSVGHGAGRDDAHHLPLERPFGGCRIAELLADRHALALAHQPREVTVDGVIRHAGHRNRPARGLTARGEGDVEQRGGAAGVVVEELVEVAHAVKEQDVRVLALDAQVLLHHRRVVFVGLVVQGLICCCPKGVQNSGRLRRVLPCRAGSEPSAPRWNA